uniref:Uncharacterized protein n=1 Tax=Setaria viridis TaxID=4556 RepID=A0A4U6VR69_SETVI|nr:hypothetical protein SEVIR_2G081266v2 [Setaria viridis]
MRTHSPGLVQKATATSFFPKTASFFASTASLRRHPKHLPPRSNSSVRAAVTPSSSSPPPEAPREAVRGI